MNGVGISYTGTDGRTSRFTATSAADAMSKLNGIKGYAMNEADEISKAFSDSWREKRKRDAREFVNTETLSGNVSGAKYASGNGSVSSVQRVAGLRMDGNAIVATVQDEFVNEDGRIVRYGPQRETKLTDIAKKSETPSTVQISGKVRIVTGTEYDPSSHQLVNTYGYVKVEDGNLVVVDGGTEVITTAVEESV